MTRQDFSSTNLLVETLMRIEGLGRKASWHLTERYRTWENFVARGSKDELLQANFLPEAARQALFCALKNPDPPRLSTHFFSCWDPRYPLRLNYLYDPPCGLFYRGNLDLLKKPGLTVAVVGTRRASRYALEACAALIAQMRPFQPVIVSGLALGIDGRAHRTALEQGMDTIAVLGTSVENIFPSQHRGLAREIIQQGLLLSEQPAGLRYAKWHFPQRNRIIAALADVVVVVEAPEKSGALLTAGFAIDLGKEVYVCPGPITTALNRGGHRLIQEGAQLLMDGKEIFAARGLDKLPVLESKEDAKNGELFPKKPAVPPRPLPETERKLLEIIAFKASHIDKIVDMSHLPSPQVLSLLVQLSLKGLVVELPGSRFELSPNCRELLSKPES